MSSNLKVRGKRARPTRTELAAYYDALRSKASEGDVQATALLIALAERRPLIPAVVPA